MLLDCVLDTIITKIILPKGMLDEKHDVGSIWKCVPLNDSILNLIKDKVHHIKGEILIRVGRSSTLMGKEEKINKRGADGIIVATTRGNILSEDADKLIIEWKQTIDKADNACGVIEIIKLVLVRLCTWRVNMATHRIIPIISNPRERQT
jgi:hypothetical protein